MTIRPMRLCLAVAILTAGFAAIGFADDGAIAARIDEVIAAKFDGAPAAPKSDDAEFLRRVWLDLAGSIPSADETRAFLDDASSDKRERVVDQLLAAPTYATRMKQLFHVMLMERQGDNAHWEQYLQTSFEQNKHWDQMVGEILNPDPNDEIRKGAGFFYTKRLEHNGQVPIDYPGLTRDVSRLLLGMDLQCAQCHDHLFIGDYKQLDFQGLYTVFLNLTIQGGDVPAVAEKKYEKQLEFVSVFDPTQRQTGPRIPFYKDVPVPEQTQDGQPVSVLALLAEEFPKPDNSFFAKNIANRLWFVMMGRGLVHPLDLHHSDNPPSHPELLDLLAQEFVAHDFDIKWMLRTLALTETYQRSSRYAHTGGGNAPAPHTYLAGNEKRLSAEQLLSITLAATGNLERLSRPTADGKPNSEYVDLKAKFVTAFANEAREPEDEFNATVKAALFTLNDDAVLQLTHRHPENLLDRLKNLTDEQAIAGELYLGVFTRLPSDEERAELAKFLAAHAADREAALSLWIWSMLTSMEFVVNH